MYNSYLRIDKPSFYGEEMKSLSKCYRNCVQVRFMKITFAGNVIEIVLQSARISGYVNVTSLRKDKPSYVGNKVMCSSECYRNTDQVRFMKIALTENI